MAASELAPPRPPIGGPFELVDHHGHAVTERSYRGRTVLMLFGFTHCKVVCPRSLRKLSAVLDALGPAADAMTALYVTVDPERDDPATMCAWLRDHPRFTGLTGTRAQIDRIKDAFRVHARRGPDDADGDYAIAHTSLAYVLDPAGAYAAHFPLGLEDAEIAARLRALLGPTATDRRTATNGDATNGDVTNSETAIGRDTATDRHTATNYQADGSTR
jgi:protein SCO1/2